VDLFYYGSQDIPPPLGASGPRREESGPGDAERVCEACSAPVSSADLAEGRASEIYGVVLCAGCGGGDEARPEDRVELYFCDRCHVSVPVCRVDTGEALAGDGRILCLDCRAGPRRRSLPRILVVATVSLLLVGAGLLLAPGLGGRRPAAPDQSDLLRSLQDQLEKLTDLLSERPSGREMADAIRGLQGFESTADERVRRFEEAHRLLLRMRGDFDLGMRRSEGDTGRLHEHLDELMLLAAPGGE